MKVGFARQDITPMIPVDMAGYMDRNEQAKDVMDPLYGKVVLIEDNDGSKVVFVFLDILYITYEQTNIIKKKIMKLLDIDINHIIISASHTHSGPVTNENSIFGSVDRVYENWLLNIVPSLVYRASNSMGVCSIGWHQHRIHGLGSNRRKIDDIGATYLTVIGFRDQDNKVVGGIINYNCHPTVLSKDNLLISADYPGAMVNDLERIYGSEATFAFSNGASGDISTRFTRREQSHDEKVRLGRILGTEVIKALELIEYESNTIINVIGRKFELKPRNMPSDERLDDGIIQCKRELDELSNDTNHSGIIKILQTKVQGYKILKMLKADSHMLEYGGVMTGIAIGKCCIIAHPAELFSELGRYIMENSWGNITMIMGYSNGIIGYLPNKSAYELGGYESLSCRFALGEGETLSDIAISILDELSCGSIGGMKND